MERLISAIIPAYSDIDIVSNSVVSLATQWIPDNSFRLEIIIVNDNPERDYSYFLSDTFAKIVNVNVNIVLIANKENYGQGISRQIGIDSATSNWILLCDEDDRYATNAVYRFWEVLNEQHYAGEDGKPLALISAPLYAFDKNKERRIIGADSIWVNAKLYNRQFLQENCIRFPSGQNSHRSEDYPFIRMLNYAIANNKSYKRINFYDEADTFYYWIPNEKSRTRCEPFYTALLTPFTANASCMVFEYFKWYNKRYNIEMDKDEDMKQEILNMCVYTFHNYLAYLHDMGAGWKDDEKCVEADWELLKGCLKRLKDELRVYWNEITPSAIYENLYNVKNNSDITFYESWLGSFEDWINKGFDVDDMSFEEIKAYCSTLVFDKANHEIHSSYVEAWKKRHNV